MSLARASVIVFVMVALLTTAFMIRMGQGEAATTNPTDSTKIPHYFGPWTNWALSPLTLPDATVSIEGDGTGAQAVATVGAKGAITGIAVTNPGSGYTSATVKVTGAGNDAAATAAITSTGAVVSVNVTASGGGYSSPTVLFSDGGSTEQATGTAYGSVDLVVDVTDPGTNYQFPTVDFDAPNDPNGVQAEGYAEKDDTGAITAVIITNQGSGYSTPPKIVIRDGTAYDPIRDGGSGAAAVATIDVQTVVLDTFGIGYTSNPTVTISDAAGTGSGAEANATVDNGLISSITVDTQGGGYITPGGIKKFQDQLPMLCDPAGVNGCPAADQKFLPLGVPEEKTYTDPSGKKVKADEYEIALIQYRTQFNSDLPATLVRGYVQVETQTWRDSHPNVSQHYPLENELLDGTKVAVMIDGQQAFGVTSPQWLGPIISATKNKPVRVVFRNLLPTGSGGDLFLPVDSTLMGSGMGPMGLPDPVSEGTVIDAVRNPFCDEYPKSGDCFKDNRATLHLHGGITPWISDGTPHQWITPANEDTPWPEGVDVRYVPDMPVGNDPRDGVMTFFYTNQQSARLIWYHDHAWGITRLNVYAGEAAGYLISDETEKSLIRSGTIPTEQIPLVIQDRTFVPQDSQLYDQYNDPADPTKLTSYGQDPTWDKDRWGGYGNFWYHHVYMPAQNPGDPSGMSAYGRWMYGPWFWPPAAATVYGPIDNPYYQASCKLDDPSTWMYQTDPFCEPAKIPGTPNISTGMEQFNDTPIVNGIAYPEITLEPKSYRFRVLNAANDRFFNLQWYVTDPSTGTESEVALDPALLAAAQTDPNVFPTPVHNASTDGPDWVQIGSESGFLPAPVVVDGQQETTWITDPTRFDVGNVDKHSLLLGAAERADVIVDFSKFDGKTLILYNDAPAAFPARVPSYDYYTGQPDLSPNGPSVVLPGYGPNTRTVMRVKIVAPQGTVPAPAFNLTKLRNAFSHKADGSGVFESGQDPIIVGQAAYNSAYGTSFAASGNCSPVPNDPNPAFQVCDGFVRVNDTAQFGFNTLKKPKTKTIMPLQPKAIHDEMNATTFDEYGRMQATLGVEAQPPTPGLQNVTLYPFVNPVTEIIDGTNLPKEHIVYDDAGNAVNDLKIAPMSDAADGTQIWRITHNGVDTHPVHFHLYDVQLINRVTWDNIILPPDKEELGWKETVRVSPLEDTILALRPIIPEVPWEVANQVRNMNPMEPAGSTKLFNNIDPQGNPSAPIVNQLVNNGWGYVWHCHILSHEEMDMMRPQALALPPVTPNGLSFTLVDGQPQIAFDDNSITETSFVLQRNESNPENWTDVATLDMPLDADNTHGARLLTDSGLAYNPNYVYGYRVVARNTVGYGNGFPQVTAQSVSEAILTGSGPAAPSGLTGVIGNSIDLTWTDNATNEAGFTIQRADNGGAWAAIATVPANTAADPQVTGRVTYADKTVTPGNSYAYRVRSHRGDAASSDWSNTFTIIIPAVPGTPANLTATSQITAGSVQVTLSFTDKASNETGFQIQRRISGGTWTDLATLSPGSSGLNKTVTYVDSAVIPGVTYDYQVRALTGTPIVSPWSNTATVTVQGTPTAPTGLAGVVKAGPSITLTWTDTSISETGFTLQRSGDGGRTWTTTASAIAANSTGYVDTAVSRGITYTYRVRAYNSFGTSAWNVSAPISVPSAPSAPTRLTVTIAATAAGPDTVTLRWTDNANNETGFTIQRATDSAFTANITTFATTANTTSYVDSVAHGFTYYYRVQAVNVVAVSTWSTVVSVTTVPATPTNVRATNITRTGLTLNWNDVSSNETGYAVQRKLAASTTWGAATTAAANATSLVVTGLSRNTNYDFQVRGVNAVGNSPWTASFRVRTLP